MSRTILYGVIRYIGLRDSSSSQVYRYRFLEVNMIQTPGSSGIRIPLDFQYPLRVEVPEIQVVTTIVEGYRAFSTLCGSMSF